MTPDEFQRDTRAWSRVLWQAGHAERNQTTLGRWIRERYPTAGLTSQGAYGLAGRALAATAAGARMTDTRRVHPVPHEDLGYNPNLPLPGRYRVQGRVVLTREGTEQERSVLFVHDFRDNPEKAEIEAVARERVRQARGQTDRYRENTGLSGFSIERIEVHSIEKRRY